MATGVAVCRRGGGHRPRSPWPGWALAALAVVSWGGCGRQEAPEPFPTLSINGHTFYVELALTDAKRQRGWMGRTALPGDRGMLFVFPTAQPRTFWMKNTSIPLDIAFIGEDGLIMNIGTMKPFDTRSRTSSDGPVRLALEVPAGTFRRKRISAGDRVEMSPTLLKQIPSSVE